MDAYYDHHPTVFLDKPIALVGFMGSGVVRIAMSVAMSTGLNPVDLDALVAHKGGRSKRTGPWPGGADALRKLERTTLAAALRDKPHGIIALPWDLPVDEGARTLLARNAHTIYVQRPLLSLYARVLSDLDADPLYYPSLRGFRPTGAHDLKPFMDHVESSYACADEVWPAGDEHPDRVAMKLVDRLQA